MIVGMQDMLDAMSGDRPLQPAHIAPFKAALGRTIARINVDDDHLSLEFSDGTRLMFTDSSSCCERRYFTTPDDLLQHVGARFMDVVQRDYSPSDVPADGGVVDECHEMSFLELVTTKGSVGVTAHNEHNGYYGGFSLSMLFHGDGESLSTKD